MNKSIAIFNDWHNDEIEINGFTVMTDKEVEKFERLLNEISWNFTYNTGSIDLNYSSGEDLLSRIEFKDISNEDYKALSTVFDGTFGVFPTLEVIEVLLSDEESEIEDEDDFPTDDDDEY